ncbi:MAG: hypothetical protein QXH21_08910 [Ignisphaera sp.]
MSQNQTTELKELETSLNNIKRETEEIINTIKKIYEELRELSKYDEDINKIFNKLSKKWNCVKEVLLGDYNQCSVHLYPSSNKSIILIDTPSTIRIDIESSTRMAELKEIIKNELIPRFHYELLTTVEYVKDIMEVAKRAISKALSIREKYEKVDILYEQVQRLRNELEEVQEKYEILKDIEELEEERAELIQEVENLKNLRHDLRKEISELNKQLQQLQQQQ